MTIPHYHGTTVHLLYDVGMHYRRTYGWVLRRSSWKSPTICAIPISSRVLHPNRPAAIRQYYQHPQHQSILARRFNSRRLLVWYALIDEGWAVLDMDLIEDPSYIGSGFRLQEDGGGFSLEASHEGLAEFIAAECAAAAVVRGLARVPAQCIRVAAEAGDFGVVKATRDAVQRTVFEIARGDITPEWAVGQKWGEGVGEPPSWVSSLVDKFLGGDDGGAEYLEAAVRSQRADIVKYMFDNTPAQISNVVIEMVASRAITETNGLVITRIADKKAHTEENEPHRRTRERFLRILFKDYKSNKTVIQFMKGRSLSMH